MSKPKVLILPVDAAESLEVMSPYQRLKEERRAWGKDRGNEWPTGSDRSLR